MSFAKWKYGLAAAVATLCLAATGSVALAQTQTPPPASEDPATPMLSLQEIDALLVTQGIVVEEMEIKGKVLEVDGRDAQGREIDLIVDRRNGEILSQKFDD